MSMRTSTLAVCTRPNFRRFVPLRFCVAKIWPGTRLAYPILFCVLLTPPLFNRIIGAASQMLDPGAILASGISVPLQPFFAGLTLLIHVLVLKFPKSVLLDKCFNRRYRLMHSTDFTTEDRNSWRFTAGEQASTFCATEAIIPAESEVDTSILSQKRTK